MCYGYVWGMEWSGYRRGLSGMYTGVRKYVGEWSGVFVGGVEWNG